MTLMLLANKKREYSPMPWHWGMVGMNELELNNVGYKNRNMAIVAA